MIAYQTDEDGIYIGTVECQESPLEPGVFLIPAGAIEDAPPAPEPNKLAKWDGYVWVLIDIDVQAPAPESSITSELTYEERKAAVEATRRAAYVIEADPLFFGWQREENTKEEWLAAVQIIKTLNPYPEQPTE